MILEQLLGDVPRSVFMEEHFLRLPFAKAGGAGHLVGAAGWLLIEALLAQPGVDFLAARQGQLWAGTAVPSPDQVRALLAEGHTVRFRNAQRHHPLLAGLAEEFGRAFAGPVDVQVYCTGPNQPGFAWHYDAEDVFILQTAGSKEWWLRKNTVNPWPLVETMPRDLRYQREVMPAMRCELRAGDWLYIPAGYWHRTQAGEESVSLSVGVLSATALDVFDFLRGGLLDSLRWRQRLPTPGEASTLDEGELRRRYGELFAELGGDLAALLSKEETVRAFLQGRKR